MFTCKYLITNNHLNIAVSASKHLSVKIRIFHNSAILQNQNFFFLFTGDALKCHQCHSAVNPECGDPFTIEKEGAVK
jgi:hypothetical protein